jgi:hypothetical protein
VLEACLNNTACTGFMTWEFSDRNSWCGTGKRPLPFDVNFVPKAAYWELLATLQHHPRTRGYTNYSECEWETAPERAGPIGLVPLKLGEGCC